MSKILINYRREDSQHVTGRIYDRLVQAFPNAVFRDVDSIPLGVDFRTYLDEQVSKCEMFLAVIGPDWMGPKDSKGKVRLECPKDYVRIELESALTRQIPVIPILVQGASIPPVEQLPESLQDLSFRNGMPVRSDPDFHRDMDRLIEYLKVRFQTVEPASRIQNARAQDRERDAVLRGKEAGSGSEPVVHEVVRAAEVNQPSESHLQQHPVEEHHEERSVSSQADEAKSAQLQRLILGGIVLIALIGAVVAFLNHQPSPQMVRISPGLFMMGQAKPPAEAPIHQVRFTKPFAIARHETTFEEYDRFAQATGRGLPSEGGWGRGMRPVINVSWRDANAYTEWLSQQTGKRYRLPTESEWEYAARAGTETTYWWGNEIGSNRANCDGCGSEWDNKQTAPVGSFLPNTFGLYDTAGNVWEWVEDCWHDNYTGSPTDGSAWWETNEGVCSQRVIRGGSWSNSPVDLRASLRIWNGGGTRNGDIGFRLAQDLEP